MTTLFNLKKSRLGAIYGLIAGIAFSIAAWGADAVVLGASHAAHPWIKFLPGLVAAALAGSFVGWLSIKIGKAYVTILLWIIFGLILVCLILWLPFKSTPYLMKVLQPSLMDWIDYPLVANLSQFRIVGIIVICFPAIICGLLENNLVDGVILSSHKGAIMAFVLICGLLLGLAGVAGDELINKHFREPMKALDNLFDYAVKHQGEEIDDITARRMRLTTLKGLEELIPRSRKLKLIAYDEMLAQMDILINFEGTYVKCTAIYSQPVNCNRIENMPYNYLDHISIPQFADHLQEIAFY